MGDLRRITFAGNSSDIPETYTKEQVDRLIAVEAGDRDAADIEINERINNIMAHGGSEVVQTIWERSEDDPDQTKGFVMNLSRGVSNFDFIDIYAENGQFERIQSTQGWFNISTPDVATTGSAPVMGIFYKELTVTENTITIDESVHWEWDGSFSYVPTIRTSSIPDIVRVCGVKYELPVELTDIRVGANGITYPTAGDAVRGQYTELKNDLNKLICPNLMGNIAGRFYPVYIPAGGKITISTSDGSVFSTTSTLQVQLRDSSGTQTDYFSLKNNLTYRTVTTNSSKADTYYLSWNETPSVPLMVAYGGSAAPYVEYFESVPTDMKALKTDISNKSTDKTIKLPLITGSYYSTDNGSTQLSSAWSRTELYELDCEGAMFRTTASGRCVACFFDANGAFLYASGVRSTNDTDNGVLYRHPNSTVKYYAFAINNVTISSLDLDIITADGLISIEQPYDGFEYLFRENFWLNGTGTMQATQNFNMVVIPNIDKYTHIFSNEDATYNALFYNDSNALISNGSSYTTISPHGRLYDVPSNAKHVVMNMHTSYIDQTNGKPSVYISLIKDGDGLQGKKIACIGDSITWLDGRGTYDGSNNFVGYEAELRKRGANVFNYGWSGYPYADLTDVYADYGIHKQIVTNAVDVSSYDIAILFGGANDMLHSSPLGDASNNYSNPNIDGSTFNGAIGGIINYIRTNNPTCKIYLCTMLPSEAATRSYTANKTYRDAVIQNGEFWQVPVIDMYTLINVHPTINFSDYFYDATHPNVHGMKRIGEIMADYIEQH